MPVQGSKTHKWHRLILALILLAGFGLRCYNINFPSLGYHDMKENEYLSMAQEMQRTGDYVTRRIYFYNAFEENPVMKMYPQPPLVSYQAIAAWKLLGENLWGPRLFNVLFGVLAILVLYLIALILFESTVLALFAAFLLAIMPLAVFFSRNIQPESPAFFFMLLGNLMYLKYVTRLRLYALFLGGVAFSIAWLYKFSFLIGIVPFAFCLPFGRLFKERRTLIASAATFLLSYTGIILAVLLLKQIGQWQFQTGDTLGRVDLFEIFSPAYWEKHGRMFWWYVRGENFTPVYTFLTAVGIITAFLRRKGLCNRYIMGWCVAAVLYGTVFSDFLNQHNYYQMPFLVLVCVASVYAVTYASEAVRVRAAAKRYVVLLFMSAALASSIPFVYQSIARMHNTVFLGIDVAGESLKEFTDPGERVFLFAHAQGRGIARYARRYAGSAEDLEDFMEKEKRFNVRYICFYPAENIILYRANDPPLFDYIQKNYHVKEVGLVDEPQKLYYIILERGTGSDPETFLKSFDGIKRLRSIYRMFGRYVFFYSLRPSAEKANTDR